MATHKQASYRSRPPRSKEDRYRDLLRREWYGVDEPDDLNAGVLLASSLIQTVLKKIGIQDGLKAEEVRAAWKDLAGDYIARHSEPVSVKNGQLLLRVTQPAMRFHLEQMKPLLLKQLRAKLGEKHIRSVLFTIG